MSAATTAVILAAISGSVLVTALSRPRQPVRLRGSGAHRLPPIYALTGYRKPGEMPGVHAMMDTTHERNEPQCMAPGKFEVLDYITGRYRPLVPERGGTAGAVDRRFPVGPHMAPSNVNVDG